MKAAVFTICAKNYLAQALTLKESVKKHNPELDFRIFLADEVTDEIAEVEVEPLDVSWIPDWRNMAFKYNVIEFNTSIKPFCFNKLFQEGYGKVIYLDPDIYVTAPLVSIFDTLDSKSIMLTPHYCDITEHFDGAVPESTFNCAGICNLGFCAIKNDSVGREIIRWWMNRLQDQCFSDRSQGLFVDQKWMDFIPSFFPGETCISNHHGLNVAIWNLHERTLLIDDDKKYVIRRNKTGELFPLIFFHFSGFDPFDTTTINRRHPQFNTVTYPSFIPIIEEYRESVYENGYDRFSKLQYGFNFFLDGTPITNLQRRLFRCYLEQMGSYEENPFDSGSSFVQSLAGKRLFKSSPADKSLVISKDDKIKGKRLETKLVYPALRFIMRILGYKRYEMLIRLMHNMGYPEYHYFNMK